MAKHDQHNSGGQGQRNQGNQGGQGQHNYGNQGGQVPRNQGNQGGQKPAPIKLIDDEGNVPAELFRKSAEEWARRVYNSDSNSNKYTQLYKFYEEVLRLHNKVQMDDEEFKKQRAYLNMIYARAAYAQGRKLISKEFLDMLSQCLDETKSPTDLTVFKSFFEAFMGFTKLLNPK